MRCVCYGRNSYVYLCKPLGARHLHTAVNMPATGSLTVLLALTRLT